MLYSLAPAGLADWPPECEANDDGPDGRSDRAERATATTHPAQRHDGWRLDGDRRRDPGRLLQLALLPPRSFLLRLRRAQRRRPLLAGGRAGDRLAARECHGGRNL